jgi:hypothetical protein
VHFEKAQRTKSDMPLLESSFERKNAEYFERRKRKIGILREEGAPEHEIEQYILEQTQRTGIQLSSCHFEQAKESRVF